jgi:hypothetical protein
VAAAATRCSRARSLKRAISKFQRQEGTTTAKSYMVTQDATEHQIDLDVTVYVGDFHTVTVVPDLFNGVLDSAASVGPPASRRRVATSSTPSWSASATCSASRAQRAAWPCERRFAVGFILAALALDGEEPARPSASSRRTGSTAGH